MNDFSYRIAIFIVLTIMVSVWSTNIINHYTTNSKFYHYEDPIVGFTDENIEKINIGMSKKAVEAIFGKPSQKFITTITTYFDVTNKPGKAPLTFKHCNNQIDIRIVSSDNSIVGKGGKGGNGLAVENVQDGHGGTRFDNEEDR